MATLGLAYTDGDVVPDPSLPIAGINSEIATTIVGYLQTIDLFGRSSNIVLELPYSAGSTRAEYPELGALGRDYDGPGDIGMYAGHGGPAAPFLADTRPLSGLQSSGVYLNACPSSFTLVVSCDLEALPIRLPCS